MLDDGAAPGGESGIFFFVEDLPDLPKLADKVPAWIQKVVEDHEHKLHRINYIFCSDSYLHKMNREYLDHDTYTDIITFPYSKDPIESDIFISIDRVRENASELGHSEYTELYRVMIHGVLHLLGFNDSSETEKKAMRSLEDECLTLLESI